MAVLITGLGYLGVPLAAELLRRGERVVGLDNFFSTSPDQVRALQASPGFSLVRGSITSRRALERACSGAEITLVYHLAAQASAHPQAAPTSYTERTNLVGPRMLLEALPRESVRTVILGSSFRVYGDALGGLVTERHEYGRMADLAHLSKIYTEKLLELCAHRDGYSAIALRLGVVYGLGPCVKRDPHFLTVPNLFCLKAVRGEPLEVHSGANRPVGFIHLRDAVAALVEAPRLARPGYRAVNAVADVLSVPRVAGLVQQRAAARGLQVVVSGAPAAPGPEPWSVQSSLAEVGYCPTERMATSLDELLDHFARTEAPSTSAVPGGAPP
ncbi:MAG: NAD(P)-dependent oxidoreductase [Chloroflexi bacterium]|nr:NAD(P)-dependent oxidoreductase [Chloroflexota bacterium]